MKYRDESDERAVWFTLATVWAIGSVVAWLAAVFDQQTSTAGSTLTAVAVWVVSISIALRLPLLFHPYQTRAMLQQIVWLLGFMANLNWFGFLVLRAETLLEALPALILVVFGEIWLLRQALLRGCTLWPGTALVRRLPSQFQPTARPMSQPNQPPADQADQAIAANTSESTADSWETTGSDETPLAPGLCRRGVVGRDEAGRQFASGEIRVRLAQDQTTDSVATSFCPAFSGCPDVDVEPILESDETDFDGSAEEIAVRIVTCTPAGMRLSLRRGSGGEPASVVLAWFAIESEPAADQPLAASPLP